MRNSIAGYGAHSVLAATKAIAALSAVLLVGGTAHAASGSAVTKLLSTVVAAKAENATDIELFLAPNTDSTPLWAAYSQGFYDDVGLNVKIRTFPSGTTAFQAYRTGLGTFVMSGDLPSLQYWINNDGNYRAIQVLTRHTEGYVVQALKSVTKPEDLVGKSVATRVGSSGSWLLSEYLSQNGIAQDQVKVLNLDTNQMPIALCKGDIAAFFIWQPFGAQAQASCDDKVHQLADAEGYMRGYTVLGARPEWLENNAQTAIDFVKATARGAVWAEQNPEALAKYLEDNYGADASFSERVLTYMDLTPLFDEQFREDFTSLSKWNMTQAEATDAKATPIDFEQFLWEQGVNELSDDDLPAVPQGAKD